MKIRTSVIALLIVLLLLHALAVTGQVPTSSITSHQKIHFFPAHYYNSYDAKTIPVLKIQPGDTVYTESLDALGLDKDSMRKGERGNPLTGPFYVEGAAAGDILAVTITSLSLNRNFATTLNAFIPKIIPGRKGKQDWRNARLVKWKLDSITNTATPENSYEHLGSLKIPLHPFLGSIGLAPPGDKPMSSGAFGAWGGNLDCNAITKFATLYLPVSHEGAFLYLGDGHAAQGDGELNGDALETSMQFTFTVRLIKGQATELIFPRAENELYLIAFGQAKNLDLALKEATLNLMRWLQKDYGISVVESSQLIGPAVEYRIPKIASSVVEVIAMLPKALVKTLRQ